MKRFVQNVHYQIVFFPFSFFLLPFSFFLFPFSFFLFPFSFFLFPFSFFIFQVEVDKKDGLILDLTTQIVSSVSHKLVKYSSKLTFEDNVRCMAASKHLESSRLNLRSTK